MSDATETSPLLGRTSTKPATISLILDLIGTQNLPLEKGRSAYCVVNHGTKVVHQTKPFTGKAAIWTIIQDSLCALTLSQENGKITSPSLTLVVWSKPITQSRAKQILNGSPRIRPASSKPKWLGQVRITGEELLQLATKE